MYRYRVNLPSSAVRDFFFSAVLVLKLFTAYPLQHFVTEVSSGRRCSLTRLMYSWLRSVYQCRPTIEPRLSIFLINVWTTFYWLLVLRKSFANFPSHPTTIYHDAVYFIFARLGHFDSSINKQKTPMQTPHCVLFAVHERSSTSLSKYDQIVIIQHINNDGQRK